MTDINISEALMLARRTTSMMYKHALNDEPYNNEYRYMAGACESVLMCLVDGNKKEAEVNIQALDKLLVSHSVHPLTHMERAGLYYYFKFQFIELSRLVEDYKEPIKKEIDETPF